MHQQLSELFDVWSQALLERELAKKRLAETEAALDLYATKITSAIGQAEYERYLSKYLKAIHSGCRYCYPDE